MSKSEFRRAIPRKTGPMIALIALMLGVGSALAVHDPTGPMELDGNIADAGGGGTDWGAIFGANGQEIASGLPAGTLDTTNVIRDFVPGASGPDGTYHEPSNKDDQAIGPTGATWGCVSVANPTDKTDIVNAYGMAVQGDAETGDGDSADDQLFYFGVERFDNSGDAFIGLWLFQDDVSCTADGKFVGTKRTNDILILANFTGGGSTASIQMFRYTAGVGAAAGTFNQLAAVTGKCENTAQGDLPFPQNDLCATLNDTANVVTPWAMEDKEKPGPPSPDAAKTLEPDQFVEGGVNLTDIFQGFGGAGTNPPCFGSFMAETRSSSSLDATLKDYALGNLDFCDANISIGNSETNRVGEQHTFTVDVDQIVGSGETPATVGDVEYTLTGSNGIASADIVIDGGTCVNGAGVEDDLDADGRCTIIFHSNKTGQITAHASVSVNVGGTLLTRETNGQNGNSGDAVKTYVDATIDITGDGTNRVGASHSFTATVKVDSGDGSGLVAASSVPVTIQKVDANNAVSVPAGDQGCTTNSSGVCSVSFTSNSTGTTTGTASANVTAAGLTFGIATGTDAAVVGNEAVLKTWVDATIDITGDGTNRVNAPHTFTVTVKADDGDGTGLQLVSGQVVSVTLQDSLGGTAVTDDDPDTTSTCDDGTNAGGQCVVVFSSATTGVTTGTASANVTVGGLGFTITSANDAEVAANADATKTWVNARISINGDDTNSVEEAHIFTVLVEKDLGDGNGFVAAAGEDVDVTLANSSGAAYVLDSASTTCDVAAANTDADTDSSGECVAVFTSNSAGTVNGEASSTLAVGGVSITVSTDDTGSTGDAVKVFIDGSIRWLKHDGDGALLGGATFNVCRVSRLDSETGTYVAETPAPCFAFVDNDANYDNDPTAGELEVIDLVLGEYTVQETIPPPGYHIQDPPGDGPFDFPDMTIADPDVELETIFVNIKAFRVIVLTCDDITDELVVSSVTLDGPFGDTHDTIGTVPTALSNLGVTEAQLCGLPGATFGDLPDDTYDLQAIVPKAS